MTLCNHLKRPLGYNGYNVTKFAGDLENLSEKSNVFNEKGYEFCFWVMNNWQPFFISKHKIIYVDAGK